MREKNPLISSDSCRNSLFQEKKHNRINGEGGGLQTAHPALQPDGGALTMTNFTDDSSALQVGYNANVSQALHYGLKAEFFVNMANQLDGDNASYCLRLAAENAEKAVLS